MKLVTKNEPNLSKKRVSRLLANKRNGGLSSRTSGRIDRYMDRVRDLAIPRIVYTSRRIREVRKDAVVLEEGTFLKSRKLSDSLRQCEKVIVFLATIGHELDREIQKLMKIRKVSDAFIVDAIGSAAVEDSVDTFQQQISRHAEKNNESTTLRFSPGYCDWNILDQHRIFKIIDSRLIDVELTPSCLMKPRKSVSGVFGIGSRENLKKAEGNPCKHCGMKSCKARRN